MACLRSPHLYREWAIRRNNRSEELDKWFEPIEKNDCYKCCLYPNCFVPVDCKDHVKCYPSDSVRKIANYKEIVKNKYYNFVHSRKGGKNEKV